MIYQDLFKSWQDVQEQYSMSEPEPDEVYYAWYGYESYSGDSLVLYRRGDKFYIVHGSHCSCYGLEDQWKPEEYPDKETFKKCLEKMRLASDAQKAINTALEKLK